jgi:hypothetical protein
MPSIDELRERARDVLAALPSCQCPAGTQRPERALIGSLSVTACGECGDRIVERRVLSDGSAYTRGRKA